MTIPPLSESDIPRRSKQDKPLRLPDARWHYAHQDGSSAFHICRWEKRDGKLIMPLTWNGTAWEWVGPPKPRPLLYAPALAARPHCPVLLVEGEKTADAARAYLPADWEVTTWSGGTNAIKQSDFGILQGHRVIIWPDNDEAGIAAAASLSEILHGLEISHAIVALPDLPPKWDLADPLPETLNADAVAVLLARTLRSLDPPAVAPAPPPPPAKMNGHHHPAADSIDNDIQILCLGHRNRKFYFIGSQSQTVMELSGRDVQDMKGLRELCPDDKYWFKSYGTNSENFKPERVGAELIARCYEAGIYSEGNIRGRGCWMDAGRVVFHGGDRLLVDGVPCDPIAIKSTYIYPKLPRFFDLENAKPLTAAAGRGIQKIVHRLRWQGRDTLTADIFTGFLGTMMIAGALKFRSHGWLTGASGAGKAQPHSAKVLTPSGWRTMGELAVGDLVSTPDNGFARVLKVHPQGVVPVFKLTFKDGRSTRATADHLWKVRSEGKWRLRTTEDLINASKTLGRQMAVPFVQPMTLEGNNKLDLQLHPYVLGVLLGDGFLANKEGSPRQEVRLTTYDPWIIDRVRKFAPEGTTFFDTHRKFEFRFGSLDRFGAVARQHIKNLKLLGKRSHEKFIPEEYLNASIDDRIQLLQGLMDTDGTAGTNASISFCTVSQQLANDMCALVRSLGGAAHIGTRNPVFTHKGEKKQGRLAYVISIRMPNPAIAFSLPRKVERVQSYQYADSFFLGIESIEPDGIEESSCITIDHPDRLYVTDDFVITHNSYTVSEIAARCVGAMAVIPVGASTEAGIRSQLSSEAFPVLFDEAESHGQDGEVKRQMIIQMMRISTQDSRGAVLKGSSAHKSHAFRVQSQFLLASIGVGLKEAADLNRCIVMNLDSPVSATKEEQDARIAEFQAIDAAVKALPDTLPEQILSRMLPLVVPVRDLADRLSTNFMRMLGTSTIKRVGDLLATPLAGMWYLTHDEAPTDEQIAQWLGRYNFRPWEGTSETAQEDEGLVLLRHLVDQEVSVEFDHGGGKRTIGSVIAHVSGYDYDKRISSEECKRVLLQHGMKWDPESRGIWLSTKHDNLDRLMRGSPYGGAYTGILRRHRTARISDKPMWMGSKTSRAIWLPIHAFIGEKISDTELLPRPPAGTHVQPDIPPGHPDFYEPGING